MKQVTDPAILAQLNGPGGMKPVTDPAVLAQLNGSAPPSSAAALEDGMGHGLWGNVKGFLAGVDQGVHDIPASIAELGARATDAVGLTDDAYPTLHSFFRNANQRMFPSAYNGTPGAAVGRFAGQMIPLALTPELAPFRGAGVAARFGRAAGEGAKAAALTSSTNNAPIGEQVITGAALGGALPVLGSVARYTGSKVLPELLGATTGAGGNSVRGAFNAGVTGGEQGAAFRGAMRGDIPVDDVLGDARAALNNMKADRAAAYRAGMADLSKDKTVLDFTPIDDALAKTNGVKTFKGVDISPKTAAVRQDIADTINQWKSLDPLEYHTPEGMDALKQQIGDIRDSLQRGTPESVVAGNAYNAVKNAITSQAPEYSRIMAGYSKASDEINNIQRELSLKPNANPNTAIRKLQSIMRDNANTSWGDRAKYGQMLQDSGATTLLPKLAGQALSTPIPRGLARFGDPVIAAGAAAIHGAPGAIATLPFASPRVVGEAAHLTGRAAGLFGSTGIPALVNRASPSVVPALGVLGPHLLLASPQ